MRPQDILELLRKVPFRPFRLFLSNGLVYEIRRPELAVVGDATLILGRSAPKHLRTFFDGFDVLSLLHINRIEVLPSSVAESN